MPEVPHSAGMPKQVRVRLQGVAILQRDGLDASDLEQSLEPVLPAACVRFRVRSDDCEWARRIAFGLRWDVAQECNHMGGEGNYSVLTALLSRVTQHVLVIDHVRMELDSVRQCHAGPPEQFDESQQSRPPVLPRQVWHILAGLIARDGIEDRVILAISESAGSNSLRDLRRFQGLRRRSVGTFLINTEVEERLHYRSTLSGRGWRELPRRTPRDQVLGRDVADEHWPGILLAEPSEEMTVALDCAVTINAPQQ